MCDPVIRTENWTVTNVCTHDDLAYPGEERVPIKLPPYTKLYCYECRRMFNPPKYSDSGIVTCPHCGYSDSVA